MGLSFCKKTPASISPLNSTALGVETCVVNDSQEISIKKTMVLAWADRSYVEFSIDKGTLQFKVVGADGATVVVVDNIAGQAKEELRKFLA